jgi:hypothetical protein
MRYDEQQTNAIDHLPMTCNLFPRIGVPILLSSLFLLCGGCGSNGPRMVPVQGEVTLAGGDWPKSGMVAFTPLKPAEGFPAKPGVGRFDTDGSFEVQTGESQGLYPGEYGIYVVCWEREPDPHIGGNPGKSCLPDKFSNPNSSGLLLTIKPDQSGPVVWNHDFPRAAR